MAQIKPTNSNEPALLPAPLENEELSIEDMAALVEQIEQQAREFRPLARRTDLLVGNVDVVRSAIAEAENQITDRVARGVIEEEATQARERAPDIANKCCVIS